MTRPFGIRSTRSRTVRAYGVAGVSPPGRTERPADADATVPRRRDRFAVAMAPSCPTAYSRPQRRDGGSAVSCYRISARAVPVDDVVESTEHLHLEPAPRVVGEARQFAREQAPALAADLLDTLLLLTSELVTNAVIHARTPLEVGITITDNSLIVTVHDEDLRAAPARDGREGGWGLGLVRAFADDYDMELHVGEGKTAWFRVAREQRAPAA